MNREDSIDSYRSSRKRSHSISSNMELKFEKQYVDLLRNIRQKEIDCIEEQDGLRQPPEEVVEKKRSLLSLLKTLDAKKEVPEEDMLQLSYMKSTTNKGSCACQVLRSASNWSLGLKSTKANKFENSIQNAYIELIQNAKSFIYIENQFFMSSTAGDPVTNEIARALLLRINSLPVAL